MAWVASSLVGGDSLQSSAQLANLTLWEALFSGHFWEWLIYFNKPLVSVLAALTLATLGFIIGLALERMRK